MDQVPPRPGALRIFDRATHGVVAARLTVLMILSALTEGFGIVILVPILESLDKGRTGHLGQTLAALGLPNRIEALLVVFVGVVAARALIIHRREIWSLRLECSVVDALRVRAWRGLVHCEWKALLKLEQRRAASLLASRVELAGTYVNQMLRLATTAATLSGLAFAALAIAPRFALAAACAGAMLILAVGGTRRRAAAHGINLGKAYADIYAQVEEGVQSLRATKSLGREDIALSRLDQLFSGLRDTREALQRDLGRSQIVLQCGGALILAVLVWLALKSWGLSLSIVLPMVAISVRLLPLLGELQQSVTAVLHNRPAVREVAELIRIVERHQEPRDQSVQAPHLHSALRLDGITVSFGQGAEPVLANVSAVVPAKGITVIVGPSGAGKSTLADVIGGLLTPDSGSLSIDSTLVAGDLRQAWRRRVAYVQQDPVLLSASLRDNLLWADPQASDARLIQVLHEASADFALRLPNGFDTMLGDGGRLLSGGERQRLMLARALLRDPALLILDEATSAIDAANEAQIAAAIARLGQRMAVVVISHRGALLALADQTISLEGGRIVANGDRAGATGNAG